MKDLALSLAREQAAPARRLNVLREYLQTWGKEAFDLTLTKTLAAV